MLKGFWAYDSRKQKPREKNHKALTQTGYNLRKKEKKLNQGRSLAVEIKICFMRAI